jgi:hypothetical protein
MSTQKKAVDSPEEVRAKVREINNLTRTARMNQMYYAARLHKFKTIMKAADLVIGLGSSTAVAGWGLWKLGQVTTTVWALLSGIGPLLVIVKSTLGLPREVERYSKLHIGYCGLYYDLEQLTTELRTTHTLSAGQWSAFGHLQKKNKELGLIDDTDAERRQDLLQAYWSKVMTEIPKGSLWLPRTTDASTGGKHGD